jgi:hypothetical protein
MRKTRKNYTPPEKVAILRRHMTSATPSLTMFATSLDSHAEKKPNKIAYMYNETSIQSMLVF